jgi:hypothetical protein
MSIGLSRMVLAGSPTLSAGFAAKKDHDDAFVTGDPAERRIAREVRHQLVMLPYYGVLDDLAFKLDGGMVTLLGAVTRPTLKSDAENGRVTLEGLVANEMDKNLCGLRANGVSNVFSVANELQVGGS